MKICVNNNIILSMILILSLMTGNVFQIKKLTYIHRVCLVHLIKFIHKCTLKTQHTFPHSNTHMLRIGQSLTGLTQDLIAI